MQCREIYIIAEYCLRLSPLHPEELLYCVHCALCELNNNAKRGTSLRGTLGTI